MSLVLPGAVAGNLPLPVVGMYALDTPWRIWSSLGAVVVRRLLQPLWLLVPQHRTFVARLLNPLYLLMYPLLLIEMSVHGCLRPRKLPPVPQLPFHLRTTLDLTQY